MHGKCFLYGLSILLRRDKESLIYFLLSQRVPEYPSRHVQRYPVDPLTKHDPLLRHGADEQMSTKMAEYMLALRRIAHRDVTRGSQGRRPFC